VNELRNLLLLISEKEEGEGVGLLRGLGRRENGNAE